MKLVFFTNTYPYGIGEQWKKNEIEAFVRHFEEIRVVPLSFGYNKDNPKILPAKARLDGPLFEKEGIIIRPKDIFKILFHKHVYSFLHEFFSKKVFRSKKHIISWAVATLNIIRLLSHNTIRMIDTLPDNTVLYFFWGRGASDVIPFINTRRFKKVLVRMHRYDLFEYANDNYIPYRGKLMQKNDVLIAPCSEAGVRHLAELYPEAQNHIKLIRLGTTSNGRKSSMSHDGVLRIVSCSVLSDVKRVNIMIESLQYLDMPVVWKHLGNGPLENDLKAKAESIGVADKFIFEGFVNSDDINGLYTNGTFDLFINTSSSEGVPVSIMEAFAAGIPVLATDVGGTSEIVDDTVGALLTKDITSEQLAASITKYYSLDNAQKEKIRERAFNRFKQMADSDKLIIELINILKN
jgi:glycosyltransferase involved in cell wall biosynthesis